MRATAAEEVVPRGATELVVRVRSWERAAAPARVVLVVRVVRVA